MAEAVLITLAGGEPAAVIDAGRRLLTTAGASGGSAHVRVAGDDSVVLAGLATENEADAMLTVRGGRGDVVGKLELPTGPAGRGLSRRATRAPGLRADLG